METEKGKGGESPDPKSISLSQSTDDASDVYRNTVYKYCSASSKSVEPGQLINILKNSIGGSLDDFNNRMSNIEVIMAQILTAVNENKAENKKSSNECVSRIEICEDKINKISATVPKLVNIISNGYDQFQVSIQLALDSFEERMKSMERLQLHHLMKNNSREQRSRAWTCKIHGYVNYNETPPSADQDLSDAAAVDNNQGSSDSGPKARTMFGTEEVNIFNNLLLPALRIALDKGEIRYLPSNMDEIIETAHKSGGSPGQPPNYLFRFHSRPVLYAMLRNKFDPLNSLNKANLAANPSLKDRIKNGTYREIRIGCDLTALNRSILTFLHRQSEVKLAKVSGDKLIFQLHSEPNKWRTVLNPFSETVMGLSQPPADVNYFINRIFNNTPPFLQDQKAKDAQQLDNDGDPAAPHPASFLLNAPKNKSRLSKAVANIKKNFDNEICLFSTELNLIKESQVTSMEATASIIEDLSMSLLENTRQSVNADSDTESNSVTSAAADTTRPDNTQAPAMNPANKAATADPQIDAEPAQQELRDRERSTSTKRPINSPFKPNSNSKKQRKSNRRRQ